ncbi:hypothetical protein CMI46_01700 [Candidatus Pacearchaeota archaeon]|nr:hypothetical protein [Candidatus Pacearchaeota archaeon]|tara:strand:+ start:8426 stop:10498 length:2073 start_codon:yes stop_codon:yes gene_type:complete
MRNKSGSNLIVGIFAIAILAVAVLTALLVILIQGPVDPHYPNQGEIKTFNSYSELVDFVNQSSGDYYYGGFGGDVVMAESAVDGAAMDSAGKSESASDFSTTNIQVEGVDEPDIVKNDGKYIYVVSGKKVVIVSAFPADEMKILSEIEFDDNVRNIFINDGKLIVFSQSYDDGESRTKIFVYDISDKEDPEMEQEIFADGNYRDARMIGDYVYVISNKHVYRGNVELPVFEVDGVEKSVVAEDVAYFPYEDYRYSFSSVMAVDLDDGDFESKVYLTGNTWNLYVSENNIYLTGNKYISGEDYFDRLIEDVLLDILPRAEREDVRDILDSDDKYYEKQREIMDVVEGYSGSLIGDEKEEFDEELMEKMEEFEIELSKERERTIVHKIAIDKMDIDYQGVGEVPGRVLNQFSMDEHEGNFRIATTTGNWRDTSLNHLYVLDSDLDIIGSVEDLAKGERIYSARFMGDRAYMVTFRQVDPLYVIDLSDSNDPEVLGYLKVTGFSSYLHPYDENHVIGIGKEATEEGRVTGVKIALFDVSDVENPIEKAKYEVEGLYSDSNALYDHKAFLFDKEKNLLVLPMSYRVDTGEERVTEWGSYPIYEYWQGAFVFDISLDGIELAGKIDHKKNDSEEAYYYGPHAVQRSLFMDDVLYTISRTLIMANDLDDLDFVNEVELPYDEQRYYGRGGGPVILE